jgi:MFS family permease
VPTGILADHWNRKNTIIIGCLCKAACYIIWLFSEGFALFALGFLFWGVSEALCSGSEEALLYDSLTRNREEDRFDRVYGAGNFFSGLGVALSCFAGGLLTEAITFHGVLAVSVLMVLLSTIFAVCFHEVNDFRTDNEDRGPDNSKNALITVKSSLELCFRDKMLLSAIMKLVLAVGVAGILDEYDPLIADSFDLRPGLVGVWIGFRYILEAVGSKTAYQLKALFAKGNIKDPFQVVFALTVASGACLAIFGFSHHWMAVPLYGSFYFLMAAAVVLQEEYVQSRIENQGRSTVHSIISLMYNLYGALFFIAVSAASRIGIHWILVLSGFYMILLCLVIRYLASRIDSR